MSDLNLQAALEEASKLAAKLKEERDEARAEIKKLRLYAQREAEHHDGMVGELERVYAERDEARAQAKKLDGAYEDATNYYARWSELIEERDEARGEAVRFRSLYYAQLGIDGSAGRFQWEAKP